MFKRQDYHQRLLAGAIIVFGLPMAAFAQTNAAASLPTGIIEDSARADVIYVGETHDNPLHHQYQAEIIKQASPSAVVWEMLTPEMAVKINQTKPQTADEIGELIDWQASGWPDFAIYKPVFEASINLPYYGGWVPREETMKAMQQGIIDYFGAQQAALTGLDQPLQPDERAEREAAQLESHCNALPAEMLPIMVDIQRLRDAALALATLHALEETGGPVVVITGNGHARADWGAPVYVEHARPEIESLMIGQREGDSSIYGYDYIIDSPAIEREDPCAVFEKE